jgi:hypothetical protein
MLVSARDIGGVVASPGGVETPTGSRASPGSVSSEDWKYMRAALEEKKRVEALQSAKRLRLQEVEALRSGFSDTSSDDGDAEQELAVVGAGRNSMLFRYRSKEVREMSKNDIFKGVVKDLAAELMYVEGLRSEDPAAVKRHYDELVLHLPMMIKRHSLTAVQMANPGAAYVSVLENFLARHASWKGSDGGKARRRVKFPRESEKGASRSRKRSDIGLGLRCAG